MRKIKFNNRTEAVEYFLREYSCQINPIGELSKMVLLGCNTSLQCISVVSSYKHMPDKIKQYRANPKLAYIEHSHLK